MENNEKQRKIVCFLKANLNLEMTFIMELTSPEFSNHLMFRQKFLTFFWSMDSSFWLAPIQQYSKNLDNNSFAQRRYNSSDAASPLPREQRVQNGFWMQNGSEFYSDGKLPSSSALYRVFELKSGHPLNNPDRIEDRFCSLF